MRVGTAIAVGLPAVALAALVWAALRNGTPAALTVSGRTATVTMRWPYNLLSLRRRVSFDVGSVRNAYVDPSVRQRSKGTFRIGTSVFPGGPIAGTFVGDGERVFWSVRHGSALVIDLERGCDFHRLVVEVEDPTSDAHRVMAAR